MEYRLIATCPEETKDTLADELIAAGASDVQPGYKMVSFLVDKKGFYRTHLTLRTPSNLLLQVRNCAAKSDVMLQSQASRVRWDDFMGLDSTYIVDGRAGDRGEDFMSSNDISKAVRKGIEDYFMHRTNQIPKVNLKDPDVKIVAFVRKGRCTISISTSGKSLHKRGYKSDKHPAPIKETLAAAVLKKAGYDGSLPLYDPMCGSGTFLVEGAYMALNKAPMIHRKRGEFGFEELRIFDRDCWRQVQDEVRLEKLAQPNAPILGSDIRHEFVEFAKENAGRARVAHMMDLFCSDFLDSQPPVEQPGFLVMNLPYGERIGDDDLEEFYKKVGRTLKFNYPGWRAVVLAAEESPYKCLGLRPNKKWNLLNGSIPIKVLLFDLYAGSRH